MMNCNIYTEHNLPLINNKRKTFFSSLKKKNTHKHHQTRFEKKKTNKNNRTVLINRIIQFITSSVLTATHFQYVRYGAAVSNASIGYCLIFHTTSAAQAQKCEMVSVSTEKKLFSLSFSLSVSFSREMPLYIDMILNGFFLSSESVENRKYYKKKELMRS